MTGLTCSVAASGAVVRRNGLANVTPVTTHLTAFRLWVSLGANRLNQTRPQVRHRASRSMVISGQSTVSVSCVSRDAGMVGPSPFDRTTSSNQCICVSERFGIPVTFLLTMRDRSRIILS